MSGAALRACLLAALAAAGCQRHESPAAARARADEDFLVAQIADLKDLIAKAERGDLVTPDRIAIGVSEDVVAQLLEASLPQETLIAGRVRVRIESAHAYFRGNNALFLFQAVARDAMHEGVTARLEIAGSLERMRIENGTLLGDLVPRHFKAIDTSLGDMAADALEALVKENASSLKGLIPAVEIPVHLEQAVTLDGLEEGPVTTRAGELPLAITVAEVIPVQQRLWVLLDAKAGPWRTRAKAEAAP